MRESPKKPSALFDAAEYGNRGPNGQPIESTELPPEEQPKRISPARLMLVLKRQKFMCPYTGRKLTAATAKHVFHVPLSKGGLATSDNLRLVHEDAAKVKGSLTFEELVSLCRDVMEAVRKGERADRASG